MDNHIENYVMRNEGINLRILKSLKPKCWEIVKTTRVTNTTEEPLKEAPAKTNAHVLYKTIYLFPTQ